MFGASFLSVLSIIHLFFVSDNDMWYNCFLQFLNALVWRKDITIMLKMWKNTWRPSKILTSSSFPNCYSFIFWVQNNLVKFEKPRSCEKEWVFHLLTLFFFFSFSFLSRMTTKFSKQKLAKAQEKKAKSGLIRGLLSRKRLKAGDVPKMIM